jgi:Tfp pilus assembly protein PilF
VWYLAGDYEHASSLLAQAVSGLPNNAEVHLHAAFAYQAAGARAAAATEWQAALKLDPKLGDREEVQPLLRKMGK